MAKDGEVIFDFIRKLIAGSGRTPSKTEICQALLNEKIVHSMGTAQKYTTAFFVADNLRAQFRAPQADAAQLPERLRSAFEASISALEVLRNEAVAALDDTVRESSATFATMSAAHSSAQQIEIEELGADSA